jgi:porphobilinogen synthase
MRRFAQYKSGPGIREWYAETELKADSFILPLFISGPGKKPGPIKGFGGVKSFTPAGAAQEAKRAAESGVNKFLIFGTAGKKFKDAAGSFAVSAGNPVVEAVRAIKRVVPGAEVATDICLCAYTDHGHCGIMGRRFIDNKKTLEQMARMAILHASAGADIVAPSAMADGQVQAIRLALDSAGYIRVKVMGYSAKFASSMYGPFRHAAGSAPAFGDRRSYQIDYRDKLQALQEISADLEEGADIVMVKPASHYLDIVALAKQAHPDARIAAYQVSGEYMMLRAAAEEGAIDEQETVLESLTAIKRAGAELIITYYAKEAAKWLKDLQ